MTRTLGTLSKDIVVRIAIRYIMPFQDVALYHKIPNYIKDEVNIST